MSSQSGGYYLPEPSRWPIVGSIGLFFLAFGAVLTMNAVSGGWYVVLVGAIVMTYMLFGWFGTVIGESESGKYNKQVDVSFRWSMSWFIFSEVMFFAAFFGALFYMRVLSVPWLTDAETGSLLWDGFVAGWPTDGPGVDSKFTPMGAWGLPAINTALLLTSGVTYNGRTLGFEGRKACAFKLVYVPHYCFGRVVPGSAGLGIYPWLS
jgi:cytochrome c oxidase subunit 3